ncbi:tRNA pseudouridine(55) synthase TruB [Sphingosinicella sp. LY1275]|uniref:tRNA pseudouridine(55) synthase TruB n=1 Tax=Sphingosinicella sp. LY1275 TaxID=3095379 RepID=UPI002ADEECF5|nr:tRNA pseudouridine(55) synthase TruB [Sphingosinicella sp. LY1275]MEA1015201.1 tRNA pseudouridine(55) synthase TruB [Sphingosinicella sp. LY1275]
MALHGWLIVDKPLGPGSTQIVSAVKRALKAGGYPKMKVGHGGTLDPLASGVLPVALGEATKLSGRMLDADKIYEFTIGFGAETSTLDGEGEVVATSDVRPTLAALEAALPRFTGPIEQVPPAYSALMVDGKRAYDRARAGEQVEMKTRAVTVHELSRRHPRASGEPASCSGAGQSEKRDSRVRGNDDEGEGGEELDSVTLIARVSKGTYIRSLARDIARAVGTLGSVTMLRRTKAGPFTLEGAISLDKLADLGHARQLEQALLPLTAGLDDIPALPVAPDQARLLRQGQKVIGIAAQPGHYLATDQSVPVALVELSEGELRVVRGFNL